MRPTPLSVAERLCMIPDPAGLPLSNFSLVTFELTKGQQILTFNSKRRSWTLSFHIPLMLLKFSSLPSLTLVYTSVLVGSVAQRAPRTGRKRQSSLTCLFFPFVAYGFDVISMTSLPKHMSWSFPPTFPSRCFKVSGLTFGAEFCVWRQVQGPVSHCRVWTPSPAPLVEDTSFPHMFLGSPVRDLLAV